MNSFHKLSVPVLLAIFGACGHTDPVSTAPASSAVAQGTQAAPAAVPARAPEPDEPIPTEKFADGERAFRTVKDTLLTSYYSAGLTEDDLYRAAAEGMLARIEPNMQKWNKLLSPAELADMEADMKGEVVGVGVKIHFDATNGHIGVLGTVAGSPAEREKLLPGDEILSVGGKLYKGKQMRDVVRDVRGKAGENVTLTVLRDDKIFSVTLKREIVPIDVASGGMLANGVGYVRIHTFHEKTPAVLKGVLGTLSGARAVVLDLRMNAGGLFDEAITSAGFFLKPGTPIVKVSKRGLPSETVVAKGERLVGDMPLVVLVNEDTASGAELLAAALAEGRGAQLVGTHTFGKWSVQKLDKLPNGYAMKYTTSLFTTPSGRSFGGVGVSPDVEVAFGGGGGDHTLDKLLAQSDLAKRAAEDPQLRTAIGLLRPRP